MEHMGTINGVIVLITGIRGVMESQGLPPVSNFGKFPNEMEVFAIENGSYIVDLPMKIVIFHSNLLVYQ